MKRFSFMLLLLFLGTILISQEKTFSPFPSRLKVYKNELEVILTWSDSPDLSGEEYAIYRSTQPVTEEFIRSNSPIAMMPEGMGIYTDTPDSFGEFYYGIICVTSQREYPICLPFRNCSDKPVILENQKFQERWANRISEIKTDIVDNQIALSFEGESTDRSMAIFRSTEPINVSSAVEEAQLIRILEPGVKSYLDSPIAGIAYYYAVIDYDLYHSGDKNVIRDGNYTKKSISLPISQLYGAEYYHTEPRRAPLPDIKLEQFFEEIQEANLLLPPEQPLEDSLELRINKFTNNRTPVNIFHEPELLAFEQSDSRLAFQNKLRDVVEQTMIAEKDWVKASVELLSLVKNTEEPAEKARIYFYLGQCKYFQEKWEEAYLGFTLSFTIYPRESKQWMESAFSKL